MVGMALLVEQCTHAAAHCCSTTAQQDVYMTVQLQTKIYSWNEWLAWLCSFSNACSSRLLYTQHAAD
jgi:hypothetical protein